MIGPVASRLLQVSLVYIVRIMRVHTNSIMNGKVLPHLSNWLLYTFSIVIESKGEFSHSLSLLFANK